MKKMARTGLLSGLFVAIMVSCTALRVTRTSANRVTDLSERWNDTDSRLVAEKMLEDITKAPWLDRFRQTHTRQGQQCLSRENEVEQTSFLNTRKPVLLVGTMLNKSHEHIEADTFLKDLERVLIQEGEVRIVANSFFREKLREEKVEQTAFSSPETQKRLGRELGADYILCGTINTIVDTEGGNKVTFFQIDLELIDLETHELVWIGAKKIKKYKGKGKRIKRKYRGAIPAA